MEKYESELQEVIDNILECLFRNRTYFFASTKYEQFANSKELFEDALNALVDSGMIEQVNDRGFSTGGKGNNELIDYNNPHQFKLTSKGAASKKR